MNTDKLKEILTPLSDNPVQAYFSNRVQISDVMEWVLEQTGPSDIKISTFSTSEEFIRKVMRLKSVGKIGQCSLFCDIRAARKTLAVYSFIKSVFDSVFLCENHSKVLLFTGGAVDVAIITSQNQTRGDRFECGVVSTLPAMVGYLSAQLVNLEKISRPLNELVRRTN